MAYEARRDDDLSKEEEKARSDSNNAQAVRTLTAAAKEVPEAHVQAVARGLDLASKATGGKSDEFIEVVARNPCKCFVRFLSE